MRKYYRVSTTALALLPVLAFGGAAVAHAADAATDTGARVRVTENGTIITPSSSLPRPGMAGRAHTNVEIFVPRGRSMRSTKPGGLNETPASLACLYGVTKNAEYCNPTTLTTVATGGSKMIAIVDAYDNARALSDLEVYSKQYGLPAPTSDTFQVVYASGTKPGVDSTGGWELEESLDIDMAHAIAPKAKVVLVEAATDSTADLVQAEHVAIKMVEAAGGGEVTNSWGGEEYGAEANLEKDFTGNHVVVFASAGDSPGVIEPSALADVVSVGGTSVERSVKGKFIRQVTWSSGGGGVSDFVPTPSFQSSLTGIVGIRRGTPDVAAVANPQTGVWVYDTNPYSGQVLKWVVLGGTSVASPLMAAITNQSGNFAASANDFLTGLYAELGNAADLYDVTHGVCNNAASGTASVGYDLCTGIGTPASRALKK
jgi:subtilase family serine protease